MKRDLSTPENREFWAFVSQTAKEVEENFPAWKRGDNPYVWRCRKCGMEATKRFPQNTCITINPEHDWIKNTRKC